MKAIRIANNFDPTFVGVDNAQRIGERLGEKSVSVKPAFRQVPGIQTSSSAGTFSQELTNDVFMRHVNGEVGDAKPVSFNDHYIKN